MDSLAIDGFSRGSLEKIQHLLSEAKKYKEQGNESYQAKQHVKAIRNYHKSLLFIKSITQGQDSVGMLLGFNQREALPSDVQQAIAKLSRDCHNNLAASLMCKESPDYHKVIKYCDLVIEDQPNNAKAYFRKGVSLYNLRDYEKSLKSFLSAKEHMTSPDAQVQKYIDWCHQEIRKQEQGVKATYQNMFKHMAV